MSNRTLEQSFYDLNEQIREAQEHGVEEIRGENYISQASMDRVLDRLGLNNEELATFLIGSVPPDEMPVMLFDLENPPMGLVLLFASMSDEQMSIIADMVRTFGVQQTMGVITLIFREGILLGAAHTRGTTADLSDSIADPH